MSRNQPWEEDRYQDDRHLDAELRRMLQTALEEQAQADQRSTSTSTIAVELAAVFALTDTPRPAAVPSSTGQSFWDCLTAAERETLETAADRRVYPAGTVLCRQGHHAEHDLVIMSGWTVVRIEQSGKERAIATRGPGDIIGERAVLQTARRSATVTALDTVYALLLPTEKFARFIQRYPHILELVERQVYDRLTEERNTRGQIVVTDLDEFRRIGPEDSPASADTARQSNNSNER